MNDYMLKPSNMNELILRNNTQTMKLKKTTIANINMDAVY